MDQLNQPSKLAQVKSSARPPMPSGWLTEPEIKGSFQEHRKLLMALSAPSGSDKTRVFPSEHTANQARQDRSARSEGKTHAAQH